MTKKLASKGKLLKPKPNQIKNRSLQLIEQSYELSSHGSRHNQENCLKHQKKQQQLQWQLHPDKKTESLRVLWHKWLA
jgi:hypothetical protein